MKGFKRGEKGFTLVELLIVVAILGILAAVVIPNVVGLLGRGGKQAFETDANTVELAAAAFYSDVHTGWESPSTGTTDTIGVASSFMDNVWGDSDAGNITADPDGSIVPGHYFPTSIAVVGNHYITASQTLSDPDNINNPLIVVYGNASCASDADVHAHAIWMGLLVNPQTPAYNTSGGTTDRWLISVLPGESELYLDEMPNSAMTGDLQNGDPDPNSTRSGGYLWIVGKDGQTYGIYTKDGRNNGTPTTATPDGTLEWYAGFSGSYP